eukprot:symbB.v1.2.024068.t1/scaffold2253.1/size89778/1
MLVTLLSPVLIVLVAPGVLARHVVPLHRQRVPVQGDDDRISYKSVYFGSVVVGKPEQKFSVVFDTGSGHVILPSSECHSETCLIHNRYNRQASDGAVDVDYDGTPVRSGAPRDQITVAFGTGEVTGQFVHDRICLSPEAPASQSAGTSAGSANTEPLLLVQSGDALERHRGENISAMDQSSKMDKNSTSPTQLRHEAMNCVDLRVVMATEMTEEPFHAFAFDGVLGLGLDSLALAPEFSFFGMMAKQVALEESNFGVFLADSDDEISEISFGGISHDKITSALTWAKVASPELGYWQVQVTSIRIGNRTLDYCNDGQCRAVVDTGTSLLAVPEDFAEQLQQELETALRDPTPSASGGGFVKDAFPELFVEGQVVSAEQSFHRRLAEYEMRLDLRSWLPRFLSVAFDARVRVRLLTSFARLSIPTRKELEEVAKAPLVPMVERFRMLGKRLGMDQARAEALKFIPRPAVGCVDVLLWLEQKLTDSQLFLRLAIQEGINQMLQALSYYIVGSIAEETPSGAALSLLGVQVLSLLLLRLDMAEGMQQWSAVFAVIVFMAFPPLYIGILIHLVPMLSVRTVEFFALPAFMLHSDRAGSVSSNGRHGEQLQQLEAQLRAEVLEARFKFQTGGEKSCKGELYNLRPSDSARREIRRAERTLEHFTLWKAACSEITGAYQHFLTRCQELDLGICDSRRIHKLEFGSCSVDASDVLGARGGYEERMAEIHRDLFVSNRFGRFQGHIDQLRIETLEEMSEEESGVQEDAELQIPTQWPLWCTQSCKGCEGERWVAGWTGEEIFVGVAKNSAMRTRYALRASFASCRGSKTWPKTAAIFGSCSMVEENYTDVQALHMMKGGQLLVLHKGSLLDAWDLPEGNLLGRFSVHGPSPAAAFCILEESLTPQLLVAYGKPLVGGAFVASVVADFMPGLERKQWLYVREPNKGAWFTDAVSLSVDCRHAAGLPLHFDVEGRSITLLPADYSRQAVHAEEFSPVNSSVQEKSTSASDLSEPMASQAKRPTCQPTIMPLELPEPLGPKLFIWGEPVLRKYYTVYDWKEKQIGFGLAAHTPPQVSADEEAKQLRGRGLLFA